MRLTLGVLGIAFGMALGGCAMQANPPTPTPEPAVASPVMTPPAAALAATPVPMSPDAAPTGEARAVGCNTPGDRTSSPSEKPPTNAQGLYATPDSCWGCNNGWWRAEEPAALRAAPSAEAAPVSTLAPETWVYVRETVSYWKPVRGVVTKPGAPFQACDVVYYLYPNVDDDGGGYYVWRQGQVIGVGEESEADFAWDGAIPLLERETSGWWARVNLQDGRNGWVWASAGAYEFSCKWETDKPAFCVNAAPRVPPPNR